MDKDSICIVGLGYVGLPLAVAFGKKFKTFGFDTSQARIAELEKFDDKTLELNSDEISKSKELTFTNDITDCKNCNYFIVTVPTPIDQNNVPDLTYLKNASSMIAKVMKKGSCIIFESTTFPGCTREFCVPLLEKGSNLKFNEDFFCGYSPERINPGDKKHRLENIIKVVSGSTDEITRKISKLYQKIITAGVHVAESIEVAEAAKVIENSQRDLNIAFVNELSLIFEKLGINTSDVLKAAGTKWNFLNFEPGLVGGHCIGVDPYYLTYRAEESGYIPEVILAGRRLNDSMAKYVANKTIKVALANNLDLKKIRVCILGITFKENCPDIRNSKVFDILSELNSWGISPMVYDDWADKSKVKDVHSLELSTLDDVKNSDVFILASPHNSLLADAKNIIASSSKQRKLIVFDVKNRIAESELRLDKNIIYLSL